MNSNKIKNKLKQTPILPILSSTIKSIKKNYGKFIIIALTHLAFLFFLSLVMTIIQFQAIDSLSVVFEMGGTATGGFSSVVEQPDMLKDLQGVTLTDDFQHHLKRLIFLLVIMILSGYLLWSIFQGFAWWMSHATVKWQKFWPFMRRFATKSLFFYIFFVLAGYLWIKAFINSQMSVAPWITEPSLRILLWIADFLILYFSTFCFTLTGTAWKDIKSSFKLGIKLWSFIMVLLIAISFAILNFLLYIPLPLVVRVIVGVIVVMSAITFSQILLIQTREYVWDKKKTLHNSTVVTHKKLHHKKDLLKKE